VHAIAFCAAWAEAGLTAVPTFTKLAHKDFEPTPERLAELLEDIEEL